MQTRDPEKLKFRWLILFASFFIRFLLFGSLYSVGVLYVAWLEEFQASKGNTAWIGSLATGSSLLAGPIGSVLISRIGTRKTIILGGVLMSTGMLLSVFATNIYYLFFTYGILAGCGGGIANLASVVRLTDYFTRQRAFAMGIGSSGVGLGAFAFTVFQQYLMNEYGWRGSLLIVGGICLNICVAGLVMIHPRHLKSLIQDETPSIDLNFNEKTDQTEITKIIVKTTELEKALINQNDDPEIGLKNLPQNEFLIKNTVKNDEMQEPMEKQPSFIRRIIKSLKLTSQSAALWRDPLFLLLFTSDFLSWLVQFVPYVHLPERARSLEISPIDSAILVSSMGFAGAVGKLFFGAMCTFLKFDTLKTFIVAQVLFGASTVLSPLCRTFASLLSYAISFGFLSGSYALMMVIPADLLGHDKFSAAYGFLLAGEGLGVYLGPPIVGWITDGSNSYDTSFYCSGVVLLASGFLLLLKPCAEKLRKHR